MDKDTKLKEDIDEREKKQTKIQKRTMRDERKKREWAKIRKVGSER